MASDLAVQWTTGIRLGSPTLSSILLTESRSTSVLLLKALGNRNAFYSELIDVLAQLRQLEFGVAGSLMPASPSEGEPEAVVGPFLSISLNELHKADPDSVAALPPTTFHSTIDFALYHYELLRRSNELPEEDISLEFARKTVFALHEMEALVGATYPRLNHGPFVLTHSDLRWSNIIVDENLSIRGIIDWEWAGTVPRQMFVPPTWLAARKATALTSDANLKEYAEFHAILTRKAAESAASRLLAEEWGPDLPQRLAYPLAVALRHPMQAVDIFSSVIYPKGKQPLDEAIHNYSSASFSWIASLISWITSLSLSAESLTLVVSPFPRLLVEPEALFEIKFKTSSGTFSAMDFCSSSFSFSLVIHLTRSLILSSVS